MVSAVGGVREVPHHRRIEPSGIAAVHPVDGPRLRPRVEQAERYSGMSAARQIDGDLVEVGLFFCEDDCNGRPIRVRFIWTPLTTTTCRWEQAFSVDGGATWETNWMMSFERAAR